MMKTFELVDVQGLKFYQFVAEDGCHLVSRIHSCVPEIQRHFVYFSASFSQLQQFPGSGISKMIREMESDFQEVVPGKKMYVWKRKKYILSAIEIYKNRLKVWKQTSDNIQNWC